MKAYSKVLAGGAALLFVGASAGTALAIEAFSERFEEDFTQPRTILARVIVVDPYEDAVWVNWVWKGVRNSGEINQFWAMMLPGRNMRVFASGKDLEALKSKARSAPGPAAAATVAPTTKGAVVEMTVQEVEQNKRVATKVKDMDDKLWAGIGAGGSDVSFPGQPSMKEQPAFPKMESKCGKMGTPVPVDVLGEDVPGGSLKYGKHPTFKNIPPGCVAAAAAPAAAAPAAEAPKKP
jgi:hypothetical protein